MSMLGAALGAAAVVAEFQHRQKTLSPEEFAEWTESQRETEEQKEERRHREMCEAIRSTSFWRFGK